VHLNDVVEFLGFNIRRYRNKLPIKPSKAAVKWIRARLTAEMRALRGHNAQMVLIRACDHLSWPQLGRFSSRILAPPGR